MRSFQFRCRLFAMDSTRHRVTGCMRKQVEVENHLGREIVGQIGVGEIIPDLKISTQIPAEVVVSSDRELLLNVTDQLAKNVRDHCSSPEWWINAYPGTLMKSIRLEVKDQGSGLSEGEWRFYLLPFVCANGHARKDRLGIGLAFVNRLSQLLDLSLTHLDSHQGLCLQLELPVVPRLSCSKEECASDFTS